MRYHDGINDMLNGRDLRSAGTPTQEPRQQFTGRWPSIQSDLLALSIHTNVHLRRSTQICRIPPA